MSLLNELSKKEVWERFYEYKTSLACPKDITGRLRDFIDGEEYLPVCECIYSNERFALPARSVISKQSSQKLCIHIRMLKILSLSCLPISCFVNMTEYTVRTFFLSDREKLPRML